ncbi:hypothetical protein K3495_g7094 [Podosphaera aphanis]|nr:hypothetical protein K3495_g7094 [Podosphaera aphanis]
MSGPPRPTNASDFLTRLREADEETQISLISEILKTSQSVVDENSQLKEELATSRQSYAEAHAIIVELRRETAIYQEMNIQLERSCAIEQYKLSELERLVASLRVRTSDSSDPSRLAGDTRKSEPIRADEKFTGIDKSLYPAFQRQMRIALAQNVDRYTTLHAKILLIYEHLGPGPRSLLDRYLSNEGFFTFATLQDVWNVLDIMYKPMSPIIPPDLAAQNPNIINSTNGISIAEYNGSDHSEISRIGPDGHITPEERLRRFQFKLCMRCGKPGHRANVCKLPNRDQVLRQNGLEDGDGSLIDFGE